jgi:hypothetical protein
VRSKVQIFPGPPFQGSRTAKDRKSISRSVLGSPRWPKDVEATAASSMAELWLPSPDGAIAQLGERLLCKQEVVGSIPSGSTRPWRPTAARGRPSTKSNSFRRSHRAAVAFDIVKKGYARDVSSRQRLTYRLPRIRLILRRLSSSGTIVCKGAGGSLTASRLFGFISMQLVFLWRCSPCREGAGHGLVPSGASVGRLSQVGIANESDQVT